MADFGGKVFEDQQEITIKDILSDPKLEKFRYAILGAVGCPFKEFPIESFIPESLLSNPKDFKFLQNSFEEIYKDTIKKNDKDFMRRYQSVLEMTGAPEKQLVRAFNFLKDNKGGVYKAYHSSPESTAIVARVRFVVDNVWDRKGGTSVWAMGFKSEAGDNAFAHGRFNFDNLENWKGLLKKEDGSLDNFLNDDLLGIHKAAEKIKEKERNEISEKYSDRGQDVVKARIKQVDDRSDLQTIFNENAAFLSKGEDSPMQKLFAAEFIGDKDNAGYFLSLRRKKTCEEIRKKSLEYLSVGAESSKEDLVKMINSAFESVTGRLGNFFCPERFFSSSEESH